MNEKFNKNKKSIKDVSINIDFGLGKLFGSLKDIIDIASELDEKGTIREGNLNFSDEKVKGVYGFSIKTVGDKTSIEGFGNKIKDSEDGGIIIEPVREPIVDVFDEEKSYTIVMELPGVNEDQIELSVSGDIVQIYAKTDTHEYEKEILLKEEVFAEVTSKKYTNGILEMKLLKK